MFSVLQQLGFDESSLPEGAIRALDKATDIGSAAYEVMHVRTTAIILRDLYVSKKKVYACLQEAQKAISSMDPEQKKTFCEELEYVHFSILQSFVFVAHVLRNIITRFFALFSPKSINAKEIENVKTCVTNGNLTLAKKIIEDTYLVCSYYSYFMLLLTNFFIFSVFLVRGPPFSFFLSFSQYRQKGNVS